MRHVRSPALLLTGLVAGILVAPQLPKMQAKAAALVEKIRARKNSVAASSLSAPLTRPAAVPAPKPVAPLKPAEAQEIVRVLGNELGANPAETSPAQVAKLLEQSEGRWAVAESAKVASPERPWVAEWLPGNVAYWRVRHLGTALAEAMGRDWSVWRQKNPLGAVLDLRECLPVQSLESAAEICGLFVTPGEVLFTWREESGKEKIFRSDRQPLGLGPGTPLIVLVGPNLRGVGELVASILQERSGAILLGQATGGQAGPLGETRLSSGRSVFRLKGEILLPGGRKGAGRPLPPDVDLSSEGFVDTEIWQGGEATIASTIAEVPPIKRANEASLIQQEDVEEETSGPVSGKEAEGKRPPQDRGLQRAGDLLRMIRKLPPSRRASIDPAVFRGQISLPSHSA